jgi:UPF0755 protein
MLKRSRANCKFLPCAQGEKIMRRLIPIIVVIALFICAFIFFSVPSRAARLYGPPSDSLTSAQVYQYSTELLWYDGLFTVEDGQPVVIIASNLQQLGLIRNATALVDYLIYTGLDTSIQIGTFELSPAMSIVDIARELQDSTPADVTFVILSGWRMEEIAASLPTSGLSITPEDFLASASSPPAGFDFLSDAVTTEGFFYPDTYVLSRQTTTSEFVESLVRNFSLHLTSDLTEGFSRQNLTVYQAVTLASIVERESIQDEEAPQIASVYLNRLNIGMKLDADPTVQYALGFNPVQGTWWTNPLSAADLHIVSPYNTYENAGLPPGPISSPGLNSLQAVAFPAETPYYYFRARCDGSGLHVYAETFDEHIANGCQ